MEMKSQSEKENTDTNNKHTQSSCLLALLLCIPALPPSI